MASLREEFLPLELALLTEPELAVDRLELMDEVSAVLEDVPRPPDFLGQYLLAEQQIGRVRADLDAHEVAVMLLAFLFGLSVAPQQPGRPGIDADIASAVDIVVKGLGD